MLVRAKGSSHQPGSVLSGWRWLFKKFPHGNFRQRHWHKNDRKEQRFYNWASFSHRATAESMCVQGFSLLLVFFLFFFSSHSCVLGNRRGTERQDVGQHVAERGRGREPLAIIIIGSFPGLTMVISSGQVVKFTGHTH